MGSIHLARGWSDQALYERMVLGWPGGLKDGTPCGPGSTLQASSSVREGLPGVVAKYGIRTVCDAGAGDLHWIPLVRWDVEYRPFDLYPRVEGVTQLDVTKEPLPACDAILCRHVLIHFDPPRIEQALQLFKQSAKYLFASQYDQQHAFDPKYQYNPTDLRKWLGEPLERVADTGSDLALWKL